jgi:putative Holliday junction resolvase
VRVLGVDVGTVRVGVALSDTGRVVATPLTNVDAGANAVVRLLELAREHQCDLAVVGLPLALSGRETASTRMARRIAEALHAAGLAVELWDERLSSAEAEQVLLRAGRRRGQRRRERDPVAAAIILQGWLDAHRKADPDAE